MVWQLPFLTVIGIVLPWLAWSSYRHLTREPAARAALPSPQTLAIQTIIIQIIVVALASLALAHSDLTLSWSVDPNLVAVFATIAIVLVGLGLARLEARRPLGPGDALRGKLRHAGITRLWLVSMIVAAIGEEFAYRGVLSLILGQSVGPVPGALVSALLFGLAHFGQGWRGAIFSAVFGLCLQVVVFLSGGLILAMLAHLLYDLGSAWLGRRLVAGSGAP